MRSDRERFEDILEAIEKIEQFASRGRRAFEADEMFSGLGGPSPGNHR